MRRRATLTSRALAPVSTARKHVGESRADSPAIPVARPNWGYYLAMRLFVAAELPSVLVEALAETSASLRASVRGRYVGADSFHVTLAFLGEVSASRLGSLEAALDEACLGHGAFEVSLGELGSFGRARSATLWQGFREGAGRDALAALAADVRSVLAREGFSFDGKTFLPHVTLMRAARIEAGVLPPAQLASGAIDTVTLFRSDLSGERPVYEPLYRVSL